MAFAKVSIDVMVMKHNVTINNLQSDTHVIVTQLLDLMDLARFYKPTNFRLV